MTEFIVEKAMLTDPGRKKPRNEDDLGLFEPTEAEELILSGRLYIVADGVGGGAAGEVASRYAVHRVLHGFFGSIEPDLGKRLSAVVETANADLYTYVQEHPELRRMGTTLVAAAIQGENLTIGSVGDSRAYLLREGTIQQITQDHSFVQRLVDEGTITAEEAAQHPRRNVLLRCVGLDREVRFDLFNRKLRTGDRVLLCSDGLTRYVSDQDILRIVLRRKVDRAVKQLVALANSRGGADNITVLLLSVRDAVAAASLAHTHGEERVPDLPELKVLHQAARRRRSEPRPPRPPAWLWLALAAACGLFVILGLLVPGLLGQRTAPWLRLAWGAGILVMALLLVIYIVVKVRCAATAAHVER